MKKRNRRLSKENKSKLIQALRTDYNHFLKEGQSWTPNSIIEYCEKDLDDISDSLARKYWLSYCPDKRKDKKRVKKIYNIIDFEYIEKPHKKFFLLYKEHLYGRSLRNLAEKENIPHSTLDDKFRIIEKFIDNKATKENYDKVKDKLNYYPKTKSEEYNKEIEILKSKLPMDYEFYGNIWSNEIVSKIFKTVFKKNISNRRSIEISRKLNVYNSNNKKNIINVVSKIDLSEDEIWIADTIKLSYKDGLKRTFIICIKITETDIDDKKVYIYSDAYSKKLGGLVNSFNKKVKHIVFFSNKPTNRKLFIQPKKNKRYESIYTLLVDCKYEKIFQEFFRNNHPKDNERIKKEKVNFFTLINSEKNKIIRKEPKKIWHRKDIMNIINKIKEMYDSDKKNKH